MKCYKVLITQNDLENVTEYTFAASHQAAADQYPELHDPEITECQLPTQEIVDELSSEIDKHHKHMKKLEGRLMNLFGYIDHTSFSSNLHYNNSSYKAHQLFSILYDKLYPITHYHEVV